MDANSHSHAGSFSSSIDDASLWSALFPRLVVDERASALASDSHGAHSDADEFTARAMPVGLVAASVDGSRLTALRPTLGRRWA
jgi:hypothetical protein